LDNTAKEFTSSPPGSSQKEQSAKPREDQNPLISLYLFQALLAMFRVELV
jgi:hypothetical protein